MKTLKKILIVSGIVIGLVLFIGNFEHNMSSNISVGDSGLPNTLLAPAPVSTGPTVTGTSSNVLSASSGRVYAVFTNDSASVPIYLSFTGSTAAVAHQGVSLEPLQSYAITLSNDYVGQVNAITASSTAVLTVTAFQ